MSSTNRGNARDFHIADYFVTPLDPIRTFFTHFILDEYITPSEHIRVLDPCAGGNRYHEGLVSIQEGEDVKAMIKDLSKMADTVQYREADNAIRYVQEAKPMSYPTVLAELGFKVQTNDLRQDSHAESNYDFLESEAFEQFDMVITNPPFSHAQKIIEHALAVTKPGGYVIMLLRLNFFGSEGRRNFWMKNMPMRTYVHSKRMSFTPDGGTDSIEYMHCVWQKGNYPSHAKLKII